MATRLASAVVAILLTVPAAAQKVIDGDTLQLDGTSYRLHGIEAPDRSQICADGWPAGYEAREYLRQLTEGKEVTCVSIVGKHDGETVAICRADGVDLAGAMVTAGRAFAFVPYSARYVVQESAAASAGRGVHGHECLAPWVWRTQLKRTR
jgi:endonuclease YncB( thermonuclease family)